MNERIGDNKIYTLAKEAGLIEFEQFPWNPELRSPTYESVTKAHKFAELIIRECTDINRQELAFNAFERLFTRYQEHFGVEE